MTEGLKKILTEDLTRSLKTGQKLKLSVIRLILSEVKNREFEKRKSLQENELYSILKSMARRYSDSISQFKRGAREDLVKKEEEELKIVQSYLPKEVPLEELNTIIDRVISEVGATTMKDMGQVMKEVIGRVKGQADNKAVSNIVSQKLKAGK